MQQNGFGPTAVRVSATVWPSHKRVALKQGDVVTFEGPYTKNSTTKEDGSPVTYHNISVTRIINHGPMDSGEKTETVNTSEETVNDDDIPF